MPPHIWTAPIPERLATIAQQRRRWRAVNLSIALGAVLLVLGLAALSSPLEQAGAGVGVVLSLVTVTVGATLWLACLTFRITVLGDSKIAEPNAALETMSVWAGALFLAWSVLGNAALVGFGAAVVQSGYPASWCAGRGSLWPRSCWPSSSSPATRCLACTTSGRP